MDSLIGSFSQYYGMDWMALAFGLYGMTLITQRNRMGFFLSGIGCICGLCAALLGGQFGFVIYNGAVIYLMVQGFRNWDTAPVACDVQSRRVRT